MKSIMNFRVGMIIRGINCPFSETAGIAGFIVDFYCHKAALVIEVDGDIHDLQQDEDARREKALSELGLRIVRFGNDELVRELSTVVGKIKELVFVL